jgi:PAS domain S-box-containing protein
MTSLPVRNRLRVYVSGSVRARLLRLALLLVLPGLAISALLTWRIFVTERVGAEVGLREAARGLILVVDREFAGAEVLLHTLAATDELRRGDMAAFDRLARDAVVMGGTVVLTDASGQELIDTGLPPLAPLPRTPAAPDWGQEQVGKAVIRPLGPVAGKPGLAVQIVLPIAVEASGTSHRYDLELIVPTGSIQSVLSREKLPPGWVAGVLDTAGRIVARTAHPELYVGHLSQGSVGRRVAGVVEGVKDSTSLDGTAVVAAFSRSPQSGWEAVVNAPRALIAQAGRQSTWILLWMGTVALAVGLMGALHVAGGIASRIEAMAKAARQLGDSESWTPIAPGLDEADAVAGALRAASSALSERREAILELNANLAARVEARTADLARANRALEDQRRQLGSILDHLPIGVVVHRADASLVFANREARRLLGLPPTEDIDPSSWPPIRRGTTILPPEAQPSARAGAGFVTERAMLNVPLPSGGQLELEVNASPLKDADGRVVLSVTTLQDVTARLEAEEARRRSQRLEAVGQLTGGVAHEFNNLLMAVSGCLDLLGPHVHGMRGERLLENAARATDRGGRLTRQLLAFARRQHLQPEPVDLNALVSGMTELLESTLGRSIEVVATLDDTAWPAMADGSQLELVLLNLAINARDAMPGGGRLMIGTSNMRMGQPARAEDPPAGEYAVLTVADTGHGMPQHVLARAFEPFFTTKEVGLGSGLGLPQVLGVAQQLGGGVSIASQQGQGTTVQVYLPRAFGEPGRAVRANQPVASAPVLHDVRLLLVDDDRDVRDVAREMLVDLGAAVTEAESAAAALLFLRTGGEVDLVLADLTMPHATGIELAAEIATFLPGLPIVLMTGYGLGAVGELGPSIRATLQKPFRADALARLLVEQLGREVLTPGE